MEIQNIQKKQPELNIAGRGETCHRIDFLGLIMNSTDEHMYST